MGLEGRRELENPHGDMKVPTSGPAAQESYKYFP